MLKIDIVIFFMGVVISIYALINNPVNAFVAVMLVLSTIALLVNLIVQYMGKGSRKDDE